MLFFLLLVVVSFTKMLLNREAIVSSFEVPVLGRMMKNDPPTLALKRELVRILAKARPPSYQPSPKLPLPKLLSASVPVQNDKIR